MFLFFLLTFLDLVGFGIVMPMLPVIAHNYNLTTLEIGILVSSFFIAQFFGSIINGYLSDIWGRKQVLIICLIGLVISYWLSGVVQIVSKSFYPLIIVRLLIGYFSGNIAIIFAAVYNASSKKDLVKNMSYLGSAFSLGFIFGPTIGGYLSRNYDSITPFYYTGSFYLLCLFLVIIFFKNPIIKNIEPKEHIFKALTSIFKNLNILFPLGLFIFFAFALSGLEVFLLTQTLGLDMNLSPFFIGLIWTYFAAVLTIVQIFITKYLPKNIAIIGGLALFGVSLFALVFIKNIIPLCIALLAIAVSLGVLFPNINADLSLKGTERQKGLIFGMNFAAESVGGSLGPYILSFVYSCTKATYSVWLVLAVMSILASFMSIWYLNISKKLTKTS